MLECADGLGICSGPCDWLKALGFKVKCYCWVMEFTGHMRSHERKVEYFEYFDRNSC